MKRRMRLEDAPVTLTVDEVNEITRVGRNTLYSWIATGRLKVIRVGRKLLVPRAAVVALVEGGADV